MNFVKTDIKEGIATVVLQRGKVNALNDAVINELRSCLQDLEKDRDTQAIILTGSGSFFSFGFDVPEFLSYTKAAFAAFIANFTDFHTYLFLYPKPVVAALNGHTIAGGCMLAIACDRRVMAAGKGKIGLNEIAFGAAVFASSAEILRFLAGSANAARILYSGTMYPPEEATRLGLVDEVTAESDLMVKAGTIARDMASKPIPAFAAIKSLLRKPVIDEALRREKATIEAFVEIWYSESTWKNLQEIKIR